MIAFLGTTLGKYLAGALVVALIVGGGYLYIGYLRNKVERLETQVASLELAQEVIEKAQAATKKFIEAQTQINQRRAAEGAQIDEAVNSGDYDRVRDMYGRLGVPIPKGSLALGR